MGKMFMELLVLVGVIGTASGTPSFSDEETPEPSFSDERTPRFRNPIWMADIPDSKPLSLINIPGTHNSMSRYYGDKTCQSWSLRSQLLAGVRFLDIRMRYRGGKLMIYHGYTYQRENFGQVLAGVASFLRDHPTEVVLMRLKLERSRVAIGTSDMVPTPGHFIEKWNGDREHLEKADLETQNSIFLTYASGASYHINTKDIARQINGDLYDFLKEKLMGYDPYSFGIIAMDFPSAPLLQKIIDFNEKVNLDLSQVAMIDVCHAPPCGKSG